MEALLYFAFWAAFIFLMMRFGCGAHILGHRHGNTDGCAKENRTHLRWVPPVHDRDPVCKKVVETKNAKPSVYAGSVYYFCSRECRERFEAAPQLYVTSDDTPELEHSHA